MAATNYAIEGVTGEWAYLVCSTDTYELSFPEPTRRSAMKWLKVHAEYDDEHPWEALEIIATLLGHEPDTSEIEGVRSRITKSYQYMRLTLDECLAPGDANQAWRRRRAPSTSIESGDWRLDHPGVGAGSLNLSSQGSGIELTPVTNRRLTNRRSPLDRRSS